MQVRETRITCSRSASAGTRLPPRLPGRVNLWSALPAMPIRTSSCAKKRSTNSSRSAGMRGRSIR
jgi:hypothetical protein